MGNLKNAIIAFIVPLPSIAFYLSFLLLHHHYHNHRHHFSSSAASKLWQWCYHHPLLLANILFFANVDILFWVIGLLQSNNWMIDLYWTVIPVMLVHYYSSHPLATANAARSAAVVALTWLWSVRLTHNYFRREKWEWGMREDWRFSDMRRDFGKHWWWISFFVVFFSQQVFLMGLCLPMYAVNSSDKAWDTWDLVAATISITGIIIAHFADTQLYNFVKSNEALKELGAPLVPNLDEGLWRYSRHPNYFGEQMWWWGLFIFAWNVGQGWMLVGPLVNSSCLAYVTVLVERRMMKQAHRAEAYRRYRKTTSVWIPWFKMENRGAKVKKG